MDIAKPLSWEAYAQKHAELESDLAQRLKIARLRACGSLAVLVADIVLLINTADLWGEWIGAKDTTGGTVFAGLVIITLTAYALCEWMAKPKAGDAQARLAKFESDNCGLTDSEIEELADMLKAHPEIRAVVKEWKDKNLSVPYRQFRQFLLLASELDSARLRSELNAVIDS